MTRRSSVAVFLLLAGCHRSSSDGAKVDPIAADASGGSNAQMADAVPAAAVTRPNDLFATPAKYLHQTVTVDIVEPLRKESSLDLARDGLAAELTVEVPDGEGNRLVLVPAAYRQGDMARDAKSTFDHPLRAPLRVTGELLSDPARATSEDAPGFYELRVLHDAPIAEGAPVPLDLAQAKKHPADRDRVYVVYQGLLTEQFENVSIDKDIWYGEGPNVQKIGAAPHGYGVAPAPVRVTGYFYSHPGRVYGHMGMRPFEIIATRTEYLGSTDAGADAGH